MRGFNERMGGKETYVGPVATTKLKIMANMTTIIGRMVKRAISSIVVIGLSVFDKVDEFFESMCGES